jgi:hypothetical protein
VGVSVPGPAPTTQQRFEHLLALLEAAANAADTHEGSAP